MKLLQVPLIIAVALFLVGCPQQRTCSDFSRDVELPTKSASGTCYVKCPPPVGWIEYWMWEKRNGCGPVVPEAK